MRRGPPDTHRPSVRPSSINVPLSSRHTLNFPPILPLRAAGYGTLRIPTSPGVHQVEIALWRPEGTWWQETAASFFGGGLPHLTDPSLVPDPASGAGRHRLATVTVGTAAVDLQVLVKGFGEKGVAFTEE